MKTFAIFLVALVVTAFNNVQDRKVTGKVTDSSDGSPLPGVTVQLKATGSATVTDAHGSYSLNVPHSGGTLVFSFIGFVTQERGIGKSNVLNVAMIADVSTLNEVVVSGYGQVRRGRIREEETVHQESRAILRKAPGLVMRHQAYVPENNTEEYDGLNENIFHGADKQPLSTFSIDVDAASYSNLRRFINNGQRPPRDAVRIEEMINYFDYEYDQPDGNHPFSVYSEVGPAPWNEKHLLVHIGLQGREIPSDKLPPANLVFLIDVSGSMNHPNKLPLVKKSFQMLVDQLRPEDHVAIVVYAGAAGTVLEPTPGSEKRKIINAIQSLQPGGSTAGAAGLRMAYALAAENYNENGNNRVVLATDGDFNVGESSNEAMEDLIEEKRKEGVFLTVLGYGMGNLKDSKMEILADKGNGNYAYIDNLNEARKVLVNEFGGTLFTIATDVKLQVEFNPARVKAYRLIGYENRKLNDEDFNNDRKDAGDLGSGHTVTALYEIIPVGVKSDFYAIDDLKYQPPSSITSTANGKDWLTIKLRYKRPRDSRSELLEHVVNSEPRNTVSNNFAWSACVAAFGMVLKESPHIQDMEYTKIITQAQRAKGEDFEGYRSEFISMMKTYDILAKAESSR